MKHLRIGFAAGWIGWVGFLVLGLPAFSAAGAATPRIENQAVPLQCERRELPVSLRCPKFFFEGATAGGALPDRINGRLGRGEPVEVSYPAQPIGTNGELEVTLRLQWSANESVLRKWAEFRVTEAATPLLLKEVVLDELILAGEKPRLEGSGVQSYPAFWRGFFAGVEFPVAATRIEGNRVIVAHRPGWTLQNGEWRTSRKAVFGIAAAGAERKQFARYVSAHRPQPSGLHVNYNSWWTSPAPFYQESDILKLMEEFRRQLYQPYGVSFDTFCIDMGWAEPQSVWQIKKDLFPDGFSRIQRAASNMGCSLGLWISPTACYHEALNPDWARTNLETFRPALPGGPGPRMCCLGGPRYAAGFRAQLVNLVRRYGIRHVKLDGYYLECPESGHGHAPGVWSAEAMADGGIAAFEAVRQVQPEVWLESTCFGFNPSPWWLFYVNSVIGTFGDDAPRGRVPAPVYRESYTTGRDYYNLQGAARMPVPIVAQEVLGVIHQTPDPFMNDAVVTALRGHAFLPLYVNPAYLDEARWKALAGFLKWSRKNAPLLAETTPILPVAWQDGKVPKFSHDAVMPRQPYGYAHWKPGQGLIGLRNPWIAPQTMALRLDESLDVERQARNLAVVSLYPEPRLYATGVSFGDVLQIPLAPYETVVLSLAQNLPTRGLPGAVGPSRQNAELQNVSREISHVEFEGPAESLGPDWTCPMTNGARAIQLQLDAQVTVAAPRAAVLVLAEAPRPLPYPVEQRLLVDGKEVALEPSSSATGWAATGQPVKEHWLFLKASVPNGNHALALRLLWPEADLTLSAWLWANRVGRGQPSYPNALPAPETVSLDAQSLLSATAAGPGLKRVRAQPAVERINGVFLDALDPVSCVQGWGRLQKNQSVWEKPMTIGSRAFRRGLGTHADSRIVYEIGGSYRRFQSWVGADSASHASITFEVWADGHKRWESGLMTKQSPPEWVDLDVSGTRRLELVVGHGNDDITSDHADWAEARLLR